MGLGKPDTPGNSAAPGEMKLWEDTALPQVINHFIVGCLLGQGAGVTNRRDTSLKCYRPNYKLHEAHFFHSETETNVSVCVNVSSNR